MNTPDLSDDAKMLVGSLFGMGKTKLNFGMVEYRPTARTKAALDELVSAGVLAVEPLNSAGGLSYRLAPSADARPYVLWVQSAGSESKNFPIVERIEA